MATLQALSDRLRAEIGDTARSFVDTFTGDGVTYRYQLSQAPVQGATLVVSVYSPSIVATVSAASYANGTITYTYTSSNPITAGRTVTITGLSTAAFNLTNAIVASATSTHFTITSSTGGTAVTAATAVATVSASTVDQSSICTVEEGGGVLSFPSANIPLNNSTITVSGQAYRYFTDTEIAYYINTAFTQHTQTETLLSGAHVTQLAFLPPIEEYPVVILASTLSLYTLANDASFDIDIISPDGVSIPRSERYRQLTEIMMQRKEQYVELCRMLNVGMYRIEVQTLRRISRLTNRYVPVYRPQEIDDWSIPQRVYLPLPTYGDQTLPSSVMEMDLTMYSGDDFSMEYGFNMDLTNYTPEAQIRLYQNSEFSQVGPVLLGTFSISKVTATGSAYPTLLLLTLPASVTEALPKTSYWDLQLTDQNGLVRTYVTGKVFTSPQVSM